MTGRKTCALLVLSVVSYKALENFSKALYGTTEGTYSAHIFRPVMEREREKNNMDMTYNTCIKDNYNLLP